MTASGETLRTCSGCGAINKEKLAEYRVFRFPTCGLEIYRDINAAINILDKGPKAQQGGNPPAAAIEDLILRLCRSVDSKARFA